MSEKVDVVRCRNCVNYDGTYCRSTDFVSYRAINGRKKWMIFDLDRNPDDFCSYGEAGEYEPWEDFPETETGRNNEITRDNVQYSEEKQDESNISH